jgi:nucleotide-binding universal stress UspA family protein
VSSGGERGKNGGLVGTIVAGVDGSEHAEAALRFAAEEASLRSALLLVISAWEIPLTLSPMGAYPAESFDGFRDSAESVIRAAVARVKELQPHVPCQGKAVSGHPAEVILREAEDADMIVVGSRGHGGFASLLLGSVTQHLVHHARCPVVVVR